MPIRHTPSETEDIDGAMELCGNPRFSFLSQVTVAAWGRRAPAA
jgi:hypothetical protein